jgi:hypothetical protein
MSKSICAWNPQTATAFEYTPVKVQAILDAIPEPKMKYREEWLEPKPKVRELRETIAAAYQVAGAVVMNDHLTKGQVGRLGTLLLDILANPERFEADLIRRLQRDAVEP